MDSQQSKALKDRLKKLRDDKVQEACRKRLEKIVTTKIRTTFIGALSTFEEFFGWLWGYDENRELTPDEEQIKELWNKAREQILDKGNNQLRSIKSELKQYTVNWDRYELQLPIIGRDK